MKYLKTALAILLADLLLYYFLFHSGVVLPLINPSLEEYNATITGYPGDAAQQLLWILLHLPTSWIFWKDLYRYMVLSVFQYPLLVIGIMGLIKKIKGKTTRV